MLKEKITSKVKILTSTIQESNDRHSALNQTKRQELKQKINQLASELEQKETERDKIQTTYPSAEDSDIEEFDSEAYEKQNIINKKISELSRQRSQYEDELTQLDFAPRLLEL